MSRGLFGPSSVAWKIDRERAVLLGGERALLMQLAHPRVAQGVSDHSDFRQRPFRRLARTVTLSLDGVFGDDAAARQAAGRINAAHRAVRGEGYSAFDPDLLLWVFATLVESAAVSYEHFVGPLDEADKDAFLAETMEATRLVGLSRSLTPTDFAGLRRYVAAEIAKGEVRVSPLGREMGRATLYPPAAWFVPRPVFDTSALVTAALLPAALREQFGLPWSLRHRAAFEVFARAVRAAVPRLPDRVRYVPQALEARKRVA